jgi:hypothetical protein
MRLTAILLAALSAASSAHGACYSDPEAAACRYPAGDSWCRDNAPGRPYAFEDRCLDPVQPTQHTQGDSVRQPGETLHGCMSRTEAMLTLVVLDDPSGYNVMHILRAQGFTTQGINSVGDAAMRLCGG